MSMSQEEIEALMNGLDISEDNNSEPESSSDDAALNTDEIESLISQTDEVTVEEPAPEVSNETVSNDDIDALLNSVEEESTPEVSSETVSNDDIDALLNSVEEESTPEVSNETVSNDDIDALLNSVEEPISTETVTNDDIDDLINSTDDVSNTPVSNDDIDDLLKDLETDSSTTSDDVSVDNFDDILADVDGIVETSTDTTTSADTEEANVNEDEIVKNWTDSKINEGVFPLPAEQDTKVVNQLSQVANDSEEKVGQIFDVLSLGLDNNNELRNQIKDIESFIAEQNSLLTSLNAKFPNINVFKEHLEKANNVKTNLDSFKNIMNDEDMKIFEAMELMQFNDINRQKIERVMAVIRKLSLYLNNLFEDGEGYQDVSVAKHIHGDSTEDLIGDDLDKLIDEFGKK